MEDIAGEDRLAALLVQDHHAVADRVAGRRLEAQTWGDLMARFDCIDEPRREQRRDAVVEDGWPSRPSCRRA